LETDVNSACGTAKCGGASIPDLESGSRSDDHRKFNLALFAAAIVIFITCAILTHGTIVLLKAFGAILAVGAAYYALRLAADDGSDAVLWLLAVLMGLSFLDKPYLLPVCMCFLGVSLAVIAAKFRKFKEFLRRDLSRALTARPWDSAGWALWLLLVPFLGFMNRDGLISHDSFHPIYEASIGHSYGHSIFHAMDLSYVGKPMRFHFLSTRLPIFFSDILGVSLVDSIYFVLPLLLCVLTVVVVSNLLRNNESLRTPVLVLLFAPTACGFLELYTNFINLTELMSASYHVGAILLIIACGYMIKERQLLLYVAGALLILTKISFFFVLAGAIFLRGFQLKEFKKTFVLLIALGVSAAVLYKLFLSGAHQHNHWLVFPNFVFRLWTLARNALRPLDYFQLASYAVMIPLVTYASVYVFLKCKADKSLLVVSSICCSGLLGFYLLTEAVERNAEQFMRAIPLFLAIVLWKWMGFMKDRLQGAARSLWYAIMIGLVAMSAMWTLRWAPVYTILTAVHERLPQSMGSGLFRIPLNRDLVDSYSKLGRVGEKPTGIVIYGKHYENPFTSATKTWAETGFSRSAFSGLQMLCEGHTYKGIAMEPDYPARFADTTYLYKNFVVLSPRSEELIGRFFSPDFGLRPGVPMSQQTGAYERLIYYMGFGKEWSWVNQSQRSDYEIRQSLDRLAQTPFPDEWLKEFLKSRNVEYVVLEFGDKPGLELKWLTKPVFVDGSITVLRVNRTKLALTEPWQ
jgi:hypothetical protein